MLLVLLVVLAQEADVRTPGWQIYGGVFGAIVLIGYLGLRLIRQENRSMRTFVIMAEYELKVAKRESRVCNRRLGMMIELMRAKGWSISDEIWTLPEEQEPPVPRPEELDE